jgi:hypothetical protein
MQVLLDDFEHVLFLLMWYGILYFLAAIGLTPGGRRTIHLYAQQYKEKYNETD